VNVLSAVRGGVQSMRVERTLPIGQRYGDVVIHSLTANIGQFGIHCNKFISFFDGRMFSRWMVTNITSVRGTMHYRKVRIPCGEHPVICGQYYVFLFGIHMKLVGPIKCV
jgi:hypothetical protein